ncbi:hypothetical protein F5880DRAFT_1510887 [Lentinula raphanica]|nr:hypothetical protein F5880DRAFT_1510887 [Lentinula raphanica]
MADNTRDVERQVFILDEAEEEELDWGDEYDDDEELAAREEAERARQKAESVRLRDRREKTMLEDVVSRWEKRLNATEQNTIEPANSAPRRKIRPLPRSSLSPSPPPSQILPEKTPPPPALPTYASSSTRYEDSRSDPGTKIESPVPSAPLASSEGSGDVTPAAPEVKMPSPPAPAPSVLSSLPPGPPPSSEGSGDVTPAAPEVKYQSFAPPTPSLSSEGSGDVTPAAPEANIPFPPAPAPPAFVAPPAPSSLSSEGSGDVTPAAPEANMPNVSRPAPPSSSNASGDFTSEAKMPYPAPPPSTSTEGTGGLSSNATTAHPSYSGAPQVSSAQLKPSQHMSRVSPPPDLPLWILPPPTTNFWEPNSKYFTLVDDTWYADDSSLCPPGYEYREREGGFFRHDRGSTPSPLPPTTSSGDPTIIVIDDVEAKSVTAAGSAAHPIAIDVDIDGGVPMDVDPVQVSSPNNGDGDYIMQLIL